MFYLFEETMPTDEKLNALTAEELTAAAIAELGEDPKQLEVSLELRKIHFKENIYLLL